MKVMIERGDFPNVSITGDFTGTYVNLDLSPEEAYALYKALEKHKDEIQDLVTNYYTCKDCGYTHHKSQQVCPNVSHE